MDRTLVWPGAIPLEADLLNTNKNAMVALGKLAGAIFGTSTYANGLTVGANSPAAMNVVVQPGEIYSLQNIDGTAYSSLAADTSHSLTKQGILLDAVTLSTPAPGSAGQSINYLIQATFSEVDGGATVLPFYNSSNPAQAYSGPSNSGATSYTKRQGQVVLSAKAGVAATTGSQTTPAPDSGYIGLAVVTVAYGAASVTAANISAYAGAPYVGNPIATGRLLNVQAFPSSGTYTPTAGTKTAIVELIGGGGAGGGAAATGSGQWAAAGGGSAGAYAKGRIVGVTSCAVTVGAGGAGVAGGNGGNGGSSSFGAYISAAGGFGAGAAVATSSAYTQAGATGPAPGSSGNITNGGGGTGNFSLAFSAANQVGGAGASSAFGGGGTGAITSTAPGGGAYGFGSGGGGAVTQSNASAQAGGGGATGVVIIYEYA